MEEKNGREQMSHYFSRKPGLREKTLITEVIGGISVKLYVSGSIFSKKGVDQGTRLLLENIILPERGVVLDLGTGYGIIGIFIALKNPNLHVYMSDVNELALKLAKINTLLNNVNDRTTIVFSDVYSGFKDKAFNAIYTNPPLSSGWRVVENIIKEAPQHLVNNGFLQAVFAKGESKAVDIGRDYFREVKILKRKKGYSIILFTK